MTKKTPHVLVIMDGVGHRDDNKDNAVAQANTPNLDKFLATCPNGLISTSGLDVGLPEGQFGNSEVGHMNLGAGRILYQDSTKISKEIADGDFFANPVLVKAVKDTIANEGAVQVIGLLSDGGVHSHQDHIYATCQLALAQGASQVFVHAFLDGRDTAPKSADTYLAKLQNELDALNQAFDGEVKLASVVGRFFAMDRDNRWERVQEAYDLLTIAKAVRECQTGEQAILSAYDNGETDEFVAPTMIDDNGVICDNDGVIFVNFRSDRARELSNAFVEPEFAGFERKSVPELSAFVCMTKYSAPLANNPKVSIAYLPNDLKNTLGEYLSNQGKTQLRIAETEKYPHVSFFFSGGREELYQGEERILVNSPKVKTYDEKPQMSAFEVTDKVVEAILSGKFDTVILNYANGDMVGHTGSLTASIKAVETVDTCVGRVAEAVKAMGGHLFITADHGNCEQMFDYETGQVHTQHTTCLVPFIYVGDKSVKVRDGGRLCDVAPTILDLMGLDKPNEMTGESLLSDKV